MSIEETLTMNPISSGPGWPEETAKSWIHLLGTWHLFTLWNFILKKHHFYENYWTPWQKLDLGYLRSSYADNKKTPVILGANDFDKKMYPTLPLWKFGTLFFALPQTNIAMENGSFWRCIFYWNMGDIPLKAMWSFTWVLVPVRGDGKPAAVLECSGSTVAAEPGPQVRQAHEEVTPTVVLVYNLPWFWLISRLVKYGQIHPCVYTYIYIYIFFKCIICIYVMYIYIYIASCEVSLDLEFCSYFSY